MSLNHDLIFWYEDILGNVKEKSFTQFVKMADNQVDRQVYHKLMLLEGMIQRLLNHFK